ncbi:alpha-1A adrenergic receptor-like [Erpetoichthys calabaricus]|uniref:Alpha-1B adrenergic receptor n=1 Tax=Erpetoichthys calabaricus TaxID=27687 RepID=A0A8C4SUQ0_ERPCA|nr:alpha-1A adrenergic receptor-like [Erpetoichthys calabaricus]
MCLDSNGALDLGCNESFARLVPQYQELASNTSNGTSEQEPLPSLDITRAATVGLILGAFILFAIVGNILVILSVACNRHLQTPTNYFIINLAIADLLLSTTVLPVSATREIIDYWVFGRIFCDIWAAVDVLCCTASIMSLCVISIDRYIGVRYSLQYPSIVTGKKALLALLGVWILSMVISIGPLLGWKEPAPADETECNITEEPFYALFSSLGSFYIPLIVIIAMYCRVYIVAKRTTRNLEAGVMKERSDSKEFTLRIHYKATQDDLGGVNKCRGQHARSSLSIKLLKFSREKKAAKTLGIVVGMFILCWLPFFIVLPLGSFFTQLRAPPTIFKVIFWLGYFNSCLNPIIYPCSSKEFKRAFLRILKCQCRRKKRPGWKAYTYRSWNISSSENSRKDSMDDSSIYLNGSQRTLSSANPSPSYMNKSLQQSLELNAMPDFRAFHIGQAEGSHKQYRSLRVVSEYNGFVTSRRPSEDLPRIREVDDTLPNGLFLSPCVGRN